MWAFLALILIGVAVTFVRRCFSHWSRLNVPEIKPELLFGNLKPVAMGEKSFGLVIFDLYQQTKSNPFIGIYLFFRPALLVNDMSLVKNILCTDYHHFLDRGVYSNVSHDPVSGGLFSLKGKEWKELRQKLTPAFTSGKLKNMFKTFYDVGMELDQYLSTKTLSDGCEVEMKDLLSRYIVDIVASTIFGLEVNTIKDPEHSFRDIGKVFSEPSLMNGFRNVGWFLWPDLLNYTGIKSLPKSIRKFCVKIVQTTVEQRERYGTTRKDLMQSMIQLRNNNNIEMSDELKLDSVGAKSMSYEQIAAQVFIFYIAGTESTSGTILFTLHELSYDASLMKRAQEDIDQTLAKHDGLITYESINEMKFLDLCVKETLRKYPALPILNRECTKDYNVPGSDHVIQKGTPIVISLLGIHRDEKYFPDALSYKPDRFESSDFDSKAYLPFGDGARNCLAYRLGVMTTKVALVILLSKFNFESRKKRELDFAANTIPLLVEGGISFKVTRR